MIWCRLGLAKTFLLSFMWIHPIDDSTEINPQISVCFCVTYNLLVLFVYQFVGGHAQQLSFQKTKRCDDSDCFLLLTVLCVFFRLSFVWQLGLLSLVSSCMITNDVPDFLIYRDDPTNLISTKRAVRCT
jgi:hypothetical protein